MRSRQGKPAHSFPDHLSWNNVQLMHEVNPVVEAGQVFREG